MKAATVITLLLTTAVLAQFMEKPDMVWARLYFPDEYSFFKSIIETSDGGYAATMFLLADTTYSFYRLDTDGNMLWAARSDLAGQEGSVVEELSNGDFIVTGFGQDSVATGSSLMLAKYDSAGNEIWTKLYDTDYEAYVEGLSLCELPDGGFAVCGEIDVIGGLDQAWVLRMDAQGDTLWTREWGWDYNDRAMTVLHIDDGLTVLMNGNTPTTPGGPHLVRYSLDGDLLWETAISVLEGEGARAMCEASDGGLLILTDYIPEVAHTDYLGNSDWDVHAFSTGQGYGWSISSTMDGGFVVGAGSEDSYGAISRHSIDQGTRAWWDIVYEHICSDVYSVCQLSQGGYIAGGKAHPVAGGYPQAILVKYAPETGIQEPEPPVVPSLSVSPSPFTSSLSIQILLPVEGVASIKVYDSTGRLIEVIADEMFPAGENTLEWVVPDGVFSGCYLVKYNSTTGSISERCVLIN